MLFLFFYCPTKLSKFERFLELETSHLKDILAPYSDKLKWLIALLAFVCYANTINHQMALDDFSVIVTHSHVQNGIEGIGEIIKTNYRNGNGGFNDGLYRPLSLIMFALEKEFFNSNTKIAHGINLILYAISCLVLFISLRKVFEKLPLIVPLVASIIFVVHPLHTEVVANIKGRDDLLALFGFVFALWFLIRNHETKKLQHLLLALFFFVIALFSKESAVTFAIMLPALLFFKADYSVKDALKTLALLFPISIMFILLKSKHCKWNGTRNRPGKLWFVK